MDIFVNGAMAALSKITRMVRVRSDLTGSDSTRRVAVGERCSEIGAGGA